VLLALSLLACGPAATVTPESGPSSGYQPVSLELDFAADEVLAVTLGGVPAYDLVALSDQTLQVTLQGAPEPGPADLVLTTADEELVVEEAYTYEPAATPDFEGFYAIGASLTMGVQGGVPTTHGALVSPSAVIAQHGGAYHPLPLLEPGLFPHIGPGDLSDPPACQPPSIVDFVSDAALEVLTTLSDPETGEFGFSWGRITPELFPRNLAIGDSDLADVLHGVPSDDFGQQFIAHLVLDPYGALGSPVVTSQLEVLEQASPTLVVCTDLFGNDVIGALVEGDDIDPERVTTLEDFEAGLVPLLDRLEALGAEVFLATLPRPSLLPITESKRDAMVAAGSSPEEVDELVALIDGSADAMNDLLVSEATERPTLHVVDLAAVVAAGDTWLPVTQFGGLLSLDGVHFSDTGYAMIAELFIEAINEVLGSDLEVPDLEAIHAADPWRRDALEAGGLDVEACAGAD